METDTEYTSVICREKNLSPFFDISHIEKKICMLNMFPKKKLGPFIDIHQINHQKNQHNFLN